LAVAIGRAEDRVRLEAAIREIDGLLAETAPSRTALVAALDRLAALLAAATGAGGVRTGQSTTRLAPPEALPPSGQPVQRPDEAERLRRTLETQLPAGRATGPGAPEAAGLPRDEALATLRRAAASTSGLADLRAQWTRLKPLLIAR
jgi:hypothetical protein